MKDYSSLICRIFLEKYPKSAASRGGRRLSVGSWEQLFPEIEMEYHSKNAFLDAVEHLCDQGIFEVRWKRSREKEQLRMLYLADPDKLYEYTGRIHPRRVRTCFIELLENLPEHVFTRQLLDILSDDQVQLPPLLQVDTQKEVYALGTILYDTHTLLNLPESTGHNWTLRQLSINLFHDSKRIEQLIASADTLVKKLTGIHITESLGLTRSYPDTTCALPGTFTFSDGRQWNLNRCSITLPPATLDGIKAYIPGEGNEQILLLENKESYYTQLFSQKHSPFSGYLYLGGFPNAADTALIELLSQSGVNLFIFCDLDPSGLLIAQQVIRQCTAPVTPCHMDVSTYEHYLAYGYQLQDSELNKLSSLEEPRLQDIAALMLKSKRGIEQEIIPV